MRYDSKDRVVLEMLDGNDWRVIKTTYSNALWLLRKTHHRGYLIYGEHENWDGTPRRRRR
ncbi:hypothetical protein AB4391_01285 [Vibrio lentus]|uniref:hypothetical protein n=1 Tax=Vibrio lentus TaxID=136468 RepID=UPI000C853479|nr:hypothetical protein [Vibrio lentus]